MPLTVTAAGDTLELAAAQASTKQKVHINGHQVFSGKMQIDEPVTVEHNHRTYKMEMKRFSLFANLQFLELTIIEGGSEVFSGLFDPSGKPVASQAAAKAQGARQAVAMFGGIAGAVVMLGVNRSIGLLPGGAIGSGLCGAVGGGLGAAIGLGLASLLFRVPKTSEK